MMLDGTRAQNRPTLVSVVATAHNEAESLPEFVRRLAAVTATLPGRYRWEFVLVDDGSTDGSLRVAKDLIRGEPRLRVVELRRNFGQSAALQAGLAAARGEIVVSMDADLQHFPEDLPAFLVRIEEGYDLVCGWRHDRQEGVERRWPSRVANLMLQRISGLKIHDFGTTFRAYRADLLLHIRLLGEQHRFVPVLAGQVGARVAEVKIRNIERPHGTSSYGLTRIVTVFLDMIFLYFTQYYFNRPLKAFGKIALLLMLIGGSIGTYLLGYSWVTGVSTVKESGGWFLLSAVMLLASLQILIAGLLAEILVRVYHRTNQTNGYVVRDEWHAGNVEEPAASRTPEALV